MDVSIFVETESQYLQLTLELHIPVDLKKHAFNTNIYLMSVMYYERKILQEINCTISSSLSFGDTIPIFYIASDEQTKLFIG